MSYDLSMEEIRVLGALIEKENTTPDYYPLTLNGLLNACNQKSNREPVVQFQDRDVLKAIDDLRDRQFAWVVKTVESRVPKFEQNFAKKLDLTLQELAVLCVLMLRGPQTIGEIRARCARIYPFDSMEEVEITLDALAQRESDALVCRLPLQPGRKEARFAHVLSGEPDLQVETVSHEVVQSPVYAESAQIKDLEERVAALEQSLSSLAEEFNSFKAQFE